MTFVLIICAGLTLFSAGVLIGITVERNVRDEEQREVDRLVRRHRGD